MGTASDAASAPGRSRPCVATRTDPLLAQARGTRFQCGDGLAPP
jgi:hypothetical protein